ncbi:SPOR domain-containing protein [Roseitranquillus sediminis]|uniref:SPOR domain-containing protein n=1 Tax=Roseitranquillus sediminis TaxID=2809051 RepID=UPI001D0C49EC|nr:SPOR domain-containing protein [Roseitranquillus sediminis]
MSTGESEVEAPDVLEITAEALWDGRPSLGGAWVAHPDVEDPERVRIVRTSDGTAVDGALFRRERELPGPPLQVSSEAAESLGLLAGQPAELRVVALREAETDVVALTQAGGPERPYVQAATFPSAGEAEAAAEDFRAEGLRAEVRRRGGNGRPTWRVLVGPATDEAAREAARERVVTLGYGDAYFVAE